MSAVGSHGMSNGDLHEEQLFALCPWKIRHEYSLYRTTQKIDLLSAYESLCRLIHRELLE